MATIELPPEVRSLANDDARIEVEAPDVQEALDRLQERHPALAEQLRTGYSVVVDGTLHLSPGLVPLEPDSEVRFVAAVAGG